MQLCVPVLKTSLYIHFDRLGIGITYGVCHFWTLKSTLKLFVYYSLCTAGPGNILYFTLLDQK